MAGNYAPEPKAKSLKWEALIRWPGKTGREEFLAPRRQGESLSEAGFGSGFPWRLGGLARVFFRVISRAFSENNFHARFSSELHFDTDPSLGLKRARLCATLGA
jgi:hypothetical protein